MWVKCGGLDKERMTAMLLGDSCGNKYPMFLVVKSSASKIAEVVVENLTKRHGFGRVLWEKIQPLQHTTGHMIFGKLSQLFFYYQMCALAHTPTCDFCRKPICVVECEAVHPVSPLSLWRTHKHGGEDFAALGRLQRPLDC